VNTEKTITMKTKLIIAALALPILGFLGACGDSASDTPKPTVTLKDGGLTTNTEIISGEEISFVISATAGSEALASVSIKASWNGKTENVYDTTITSKSAEFTYTTNLLGSVGDEVTYTITANDGNGTTGDAKVVVSVMPVQASLDGQSGFQLYNANSQGLNISFDLYKANAMITGAPATQDIIDATTTGQADWSKTWKSNNGSTFVKIDPNDWQNGTSTTYLFQLYKANKSNFNETIADMEVGDVILVRSGQDIDFNLFLVKITGVVDLPAAGNNNDYYQFDMRGLIF